MERFLLNFLKFQNKRLHGLEKMCGGTGKGRPPFFNQ